MSSNNNETQAAFREAIAGLKEYAKVNGGFVTKEDVTSYFKGIELDESKFQLVYGYLMANNIKIKGETNVDNTFLAMMEEAVANDAKEEAGALENSEDTESADEQTDVSMYAIDDTIDYEADEKYLSIYMDDLGKMESLSDTTRAYLLMNIVEDNDKESLRLLSESFLEKIVAWIEPFRRRGVLSSDLVQEGNLAMMGYISEKRFLNNYEWKDKIKEGGTEDLIYVLNGIEAEVKTEVEGSIRMLLDEQNASNQTSNKVLNKVNLVNDWAKRLREELERKPTVSEVAERMGVSESNVLEAIKLSAENIEDINMNDD
ncbi:MAG: hypothetical protein IJB96_10655 [Lachnospira sp.]|nr:hypothetical protein [Lachnospira sp.]